MKLTILAASITAAAAVAPNKEWARKYLKLVTQEKFDTDLDTDLPNNFTEKMPMVNKLVGIILKASPKIFSSELQEEFREKAEVIDKEMKKPGLRSLGTGGNNFFVPIPLQAIWGYGCWCYFGDDLMVGQGTPVNQLDGFCKSMQLCLRCAVMDGDYCPDENEDPAPCDPKNQSYNSEFSKLPEQEAILADCTAKNDKPCAKNTCCCEMKFIADLLSLITSSVPFEIGFQHARGWDPAENCKASNTPGPNPGNGNGNGNGAYEKACCGQYPTRVVYNKSHLECCAEDHNIFNPMSHDCCVDGEGVKMIGSCPI